MSFFHGNWKLKEYSRKLRNNSTLSEVLLWNHIKKKQILGFQFLRQKTIHYYIVDFFCSRLKLAIEIDGSSHIGKEEYDQIRQQQLESLGITVLRFTNDDVNKNMEFVLQQIEQKISDLLDMSEISLS